MTIIIIYSGTFICRFQLLQFFYGLNLNVIIYYFTFDLSVPIRDTVREIIKAHIGVCGRA